MTNRLSTQKRLLIVTAVVSLLLAALVLVDRSVSSLSAAHAQMEVTGRPDLATFQRMTAEIVNIAHDMNDATPEERHVLMAKLRDLAGARKQFLLQVMREEPSQVAQFALPAQIRALLGEKLQSYFEQQVQLDGELETIYEDYENEARLRHFLKTSNERLELHFQEDSVPHLMTGTRVRVRGVRVGEDLALNTVSTDSTKTSSGMEVLQAATIAPNTFGEQKVLVMLVNFQDKATQPFTSVTARSVMFEGVNSFDLENSYGQTWLTGDVAGWFTIPTSYAACDTAAIAYYAKEAATAAGYNVNNYNRHVFAFPSASCGGWIGMAYFGGNPSQAWINGAFSVQNVGHEMGHNFGLYHSKSLDCGSQVIGAVGSGCTSSEYGDIFDIMGRSTNHFNSFQKEQIGWLNYGSSPPISTVQASGNYWIDAYETPGSSTKAIRILKSTDPKSGVKTYYYLEARRGSLLSNNSNMFNGVSVHQGPETGGTPIYLLDMTPETSSWSDPALMVGKSFTDSAANMTITTLSANSTGAMVNVSFGPAPCLRGNPTVTISPSSSGWVKPGTSVNYTVSVTNYDTSGCLGSSFNLQASVPSGWSASFANPTLAIAPGGTVTTTLTVTSSAIADEGSYNVPVSVTNMGSVGNAVSANVTYMAVSSLAVSAATDRTTYSRNQTVITTATVRAMGAALANAPVTFTITKSNGAVVTGTLLTGSDGKAVFKYKFKRTDPVGSYLDVAASSMNGLTGNGSTGFTVQ